MQNQMTLKKAVGVSGIGLHSGVEVELKLKPGEIDSGIIFVRRDLAGAPEIHATAANVTSTVRATTLEEGGAKVFTVEHLLSALSACGVDNCVVEMNSEEPPVMNGDSLGFCDLIRTAEKIAQPAARREFRLEKIYRADSDDGKKFIVALPYDGFRVSFTSVNPHPLVGIQYADFEISEEIYRAEIAPARTIAYEKEVAALHAMGLGRGGNLENVIVYSDGGWLNELRYPDELVRHKILDVIGDLRLAGFLKCHIIAAASGHALNARLAKKIFADTQIS